MSKDGPSSADMQRAMGSSEEGSNPQGPVAGLSGSAGVGDHLDVAKKMMVQGDINSTTKLAGMDDEILKPLNPEGAGMNQNPFEAILGGSLNPVQNESKAAGDVTQEVGFMSDVRLESASGEATLAPAGGGLLRNPEKGGQAMG